jgi:hypothetical protein
MKFNQALGSGNMLVGDKVYVSLDISAVNSSEHRPGPLLEGLLRRTLICGVS